MYTIGFAKAKEPDVLINPQPCRTLEELYQWINKFLNDRDFKIEAPITLESINKAMENGEDVMQISFTGYQVALIFGHSDVVEQASSRYVYSEFINNYFDNQRLRIVFQTETTTYDSDIDDFSIDPLNKLYSMANLIFGQQKDDIILNGGYIFVDFDYQGKPKNFSVKYSKK